jgi:hypothetical protein
LKKYLFVPTLLLLFLLAGCFSNPVQDDLLVYVNEDLVKVTELEEHAVSSYESVTGVNYTDDFTLYDALINEVIPTYQEFTKELEAIEVETDEVREIHEDYIEAANLQYNAFVKILTALENQDRQLIEEANGMLDEARKMFRDFQYDAKKLAEEHNVELTEIEASTL